MEGIARAKERGIYEGRKATIDAAEVSCLRSAGHGASEITRQLGIGRAPVYRLLKGTP